MVSIENYLDSEILNQKYLFNIKIKKFVNIEEIGWTSIYDKLGYIHSKKDCFSLTQKEVKLYRILYGE